MIIHITLIIQFLEEYVPLPGANPSPTAKCLITKYTVNIALNSVLTSTNRTGATHGIALTVYQPRRFPAHFKEDRYRKTMQKGLKYTPTGF